jgi:WD40 repeat protein
MSPFTKLQNRLQNRRILLATLCAVTILFVTIKYLSERWASERSLLNAKPLVVLKTIAARSGGKVIKGRSTTIVRAVAFSPDGATMATGSEDETRLWDVRTGGLLKVMEQRKDLRSIYKLAFSPDGRTLVSTGIESVSTASVIRGYLELNDAQTGALLATHTVENANNGIVFTPDGKTLVTASYGDAKVYGSSELHSSTELRSSIRGILLKKVSWGYDGPFALSPDGTLLAKGDNSDGIVEVRSVGSGSLVSKLEPPKGLPKALLSAYRESNNVTSLVFLPDGRSLIVGSEDVDGGALRLWDVQTGRLLRTLPGYNDDNVVTMALSPDGKLLAVASGTLILWNTQTWLAERKIKAGYGTFTFLAFSPDGKLLASNAGSAFSPSGKLLATNSAGSAVRLWSVE